MICIRDASCVSFKGTECGTEGGEFDIMASDIWYVFVIDPHRIIRIHIIVKELFIMKRLVILVFNINDFFFYSTITNVDRSIRSGGEIRIVCNHNYCS